MKSKYLHWIMFAFVRKNKKKKRVAMFSNGLVQLSLALVHIQCPRFKPYSILVSTLQTSTSALALASANSVLFQKAYANFCNYLFVWTHLFPFLRKLTYATSIIRIVGMLNVDHVNAHSKDLIVESENFYDAIAICHLPLPAISFYRILQNFVLSAISLRFSI